MVKKSVLTPMQGEIERLVIRDSKMEECTVLQQLNEVSDYIADWVGEKTEPDYIHKCLTEGCLPPGGNKEFYQAKSIYLKSSGQLIGFSELYHGYPDGPFLLLFLLQFVHCNKSEGPRGRRPRRLWF